MYRARDYIDSSFDFRMVRKDGSSKGIIGFGYQDSGICITVH